MGDCNVGSMLTPARIGNGNAGCIDTLSEVRETLVDGAPAAVALATP